MKLKLVTSTYILQSNRAVFNQNAVNPTCKLCETNTETMEHFILECPVLANRRNPIISDFDYELVNLRYPSLSSFTTAEKLKLILDPTHILLWKNRKIMC